MEIVCLTTEGDCEGRSTRTVGYFIGTTEQIITYCIEKDIKPEYHFRTKTFNVVDCSNVIPRVSCSVSSFGSIEYKSIKQYDKEQETINKALAKLSPEEKKLLGLN